MIDNAQDFLQERFEIRPEAALVMSLIEVVRFVVGSVDTYRDSPCFIDNDVALSGVDVVVLYAVVKA